MDGRMGEKIGEGACAEIFEWEDGRKVIKLAKANTNHNAVRREYVNSRAVWESGLPVSEPFGLFEVNGRPGIVFERIHGESLIERFIRSLMKRSAPEGGMEDEYDSMRITARILHEVHQHEAKPDLPDQREQIKYSIRRNDDLTSAEKEAVMELLDRLPVKRQLCHGDPNPGNILIRDGTPVLIDWAGASIGNPEADLAEYIILVRYVVLQFYLPDLPKEAAEYFNSIRETMIQVFTAEYARLSGIPSDGVEAWIAPAAARKLTADICKEERDALLHEIRTRLQTAGLPRD